MGWTALPSESIYASAVVAMVQESNIKIASKPVTVTNTFINCSVSVGAPGVEHDLQHVSKPHSSCSSNISSLFGVVSVELFSGESSSSYGTKEVSSSTVITLPLFSRVALSSLQILMGWTALPSESIYASAVVAMVQESNIKIASKPVTVTNTFINCSVSVGAPGVEHDLQHVSKPHSSCSSNISSLFGVVSVELFSGESSSSSSIGMLSTELSSSIDWIRPLDCITAKSSLQISIE